MTFLTLKFVTPFKVEDVKDDPHAKAGRRHLSEFHRAFGFCHIALPSSQL
jgi:hypothetical protein